MEGKLKIKYPFAGAGWLINSQHALIRTHHRAVFGYPVVPGFDDTGRFAGFNFGESIEHCLAEILLLRPEVIAVDRAMGEPEGSMMRMIVFLIGRGFHWPVARHGDVAWADHRVT